MNTIEKIKKVSDCIDFSESNFTGVFSKIGEGSKRLNPAPCCGANDSFTLHKEYFKCFSCGGGGSIVDLEMLRSGKSLAESIWNLAEQNGIDLEKVVKEKATPIEVVLSKSSQISEKQASFYLKKRGFPEDAKSKALGILFSQGVLVSRKSNVDCLCLPIFEASRIGRKKVSPLHINSFQYIRIDREAFPQKKSDKKFMWGARSKGAFLLDNGNEEIFIVESFANALSLASAGYSSVCIYMTGNLDLVGKIKKVFPDREIVLFMDKGVEELQAKTCKEESVLGLWHEEKSKKGNDVNDILCMSGGLDNFRSEIRKMLSKKSASPSWWTDNQAENSFQDAERQEIVIEGGKLHRMVDQAENALINMKSDIYQRCGGLVCASEIVVSGKKTPSIFPLKQEHLIEELTRIVDWKKFSPKNGGYFSCDCPREVAQSLMARPKWKLPYLAGIIDTPTLRRDGTVIHSEGFDKETGILYRPKKGMFSNVMEELESPSYNDALSAEQEIYKIFHEFPFKKMHDYSVVLSAVLSSLIRFSLKTAPLHGFSASKMSSGKTLLADAVSYIASGTPSPVMTQTRNSDEESKRLLSIMKEGPRTVTIDNIYRPLEGEALCTILTQESWRERVLGTNMTATVPTNCTFWMATGNNLQIKGDLSTRALVAYLLPKEERPEERRFSVNLHELIPRRREELVICALKILRAYELAGKPMSKEFSPFGRFEEWSDRVRGAIIWLGVQDPCISRKEVEENDTYRDELTNLLNCWYDVFGEKDCTVSYAIDQSGFSGEKNMDLLQCFTDIAEDHGKLSRRKLGCFLRNNEGRIEDGFQFQRAGKGKKGMRWRVVKS